MSLIKWRPKEDWDPVREFAELEEEMSRFFDFPLLRWHFGKHSPKEKVWSVPLDIYETKDAVVVKADLPGMKKNEINVSIHGDVLTISGEKKKEEEVKDKHLHRIERFYGTFQRSINLPSYVDTSKIKASYKEGVLEISLPKTEEAKAKEIKVEIQ
ncbi:MAG: Hsp20/alpha crystallin family protein [Candidatus Omnitrophica bacterium]|nr:Hsp20/alpha crystallin family protein [Candidatus Omnitrophota bacterium]MCM8798518.1 Hsp20/alpha crystallin family protein [Candidatus Omnitrophota bacterium]